MALKTINDFSRLILQLLFGTQLIFSQRIRSFSPETVTPQSFRMKQSACIYLVASAKVCGQMKYTFTTSRQTSGLLITRRFLVGAGAWRSTSSHLQGVVIRHAFTRVPCMYSAAEIAINSNWMIFGHWIWRPCSGMKSGSDPTCRWVEPAIHVIS